VTKDLLAGCNAPAVLQLAVIAAAHDSCDSGIKFASENQFAALTTEESDLLDGGVNSHNDSDSDSESDDEDELTPL
jgi:hypothetical protein